MFRKRFQCKVKYFDWTLTLWNRVRSLITYTYSFQIGYGIAKLVTPGDPYIALGIFIVSCCPGGGQSNIFSYLLGGDISLSVSLTAVSMMLSFGMYILYYNTCSMYLITFYLR